MADPFVFGQLRKALEIAKKHADQDVRGLAAKRAEAWQGIVDGITQGRINVGSRAPLKKYPPWVTLEVLQGGFARDKPAAARMSEGEEKLARTAMANIGDTCNPNPGALRRSLFSYYLSDVGLAELYTMLDTGSFTAKIPEDTALLTVAWLLRTGNADSALQILDAISPFASDLRFAPVAAPPARSRCPVGYAWRRTARDADVALCNMTAAADIETMRTVLTVWNPLTDRFLELWYPRVIHMGGSRVDGESFNDGWLSTAERFLAEYDSAVACNPPPSRRRINLRWLVDGTREAVSTLKLADRTSGRVRIAVQGMVQKRGVPDSTSLQKLRSEQQRIANIASHRTLGTIVAARLQNIENQDEGLQHPNVYAGPITGVEAEQHGVTEEQPLPSSILRILRSAHAAPLEELVTEGSIPSAEVYGSLVPREVCRVVSTSYTDRVLGDVMAANYSAFANRRSLLLLNYQHQVGLSELPWVASVEKFRIRDQKAAEPHMLVMLRAAETVIQQWPGTVIPNAVVAQLSNLAAAARRYDLPFVEELAADIFMGDFSAKFTRAAGIAAEVIEGTLYAKYYNIDTSALLVAAADPKRNNLGKFCQQRIDDMKLPAPSRHSWIVTRGELIEQGQILTTHNLATFERLGVRVEWDKLAFNAWHTCVKLLGIAAIQPHPLGTIKRAAFAWRQTLFFLAMAEKQTGLKSVTDFLSAARRSVPRPDPSKQRRVPRLDLVLDRLDSVVSTSSVVAKPITRGRLFLGWSRGPHWIFKPDRSPAATDQSSGQVRVISSTEDWEAKVKAQYKGWTEAE